MRVLILSPRLPARGGKGDQGRTFHVVEALRPEHEVTVLTGGLGPGDVATLERLARVEVVREGLLARALGALLSLLRGRPGQIGWMTPPRTWRRARAAALEADVVIAVTSRAVAGPLPRPLVVDHIDALSLNLARRAHGGEALPVRLAARVEAALMGRWERTLARHAAAQLTVSPVDARALPASPPVEVIGLRAELTGAGVPPDAKRPFDVVFTGNMRYPPNADAVRWIDTEIAPALLALRPGTRVAIAGRAADGLRTRLEVHSDVPDMHAFLAEAKVALAPLRLGTGMPTKVLDAVAAGAVVVGTAAALEPLDLPPEAAVVADTPDAIARAVAALLDDPRARDAMAASALAELGRFGLDAQRERLAAVLARVTAG